VKRAAFVGLCLSLAVTMVSAQEAARSTAHQNNAQQSSKDFVMVLPAPTCPVSMHALQGRGSGLVAVRDEKPIEGPSQRVHLILSNPRSAVVAGAKVKVFGLSGKNRLERTSDRSLDLTNREGASDLTRTLDVTFAPEGDKDVATDFMLPGFTSVRSVELESITYRDGSTWTVAGQQACHVAPDPIMLVADR
jgi:hypothetical protein